MTKEEFFDLFISKPIEEPEIEEPEIIEIGEPEDDTDDDDLISESKGAHLASVDIPEPGCEIDPSGKEVTSTITIRIDGYDKVETLTYTFSYKEIRNMYTADELNNHLAIVAATGRKNRDMLVHMTRAEECINKQLSCRERKTTTMAAKAADILDHAFQEDTAKGKELAKRLRAVAQYSAACRVALSSKYDIRYHEG